MPSVDRVKVYLSYAQAAAMDGRKADARRLLWDALRLEPDRAELWVWLAGVAPSPRASVAYLERALALEPDNRQAQAGLRWAQQQVALSKPRAVMLPATQQSTPFRGRLWKWVGAIAVLLVLTLSLMVTVVLPRWPVALAAEGNDLPPTTAHVAALATFTPVRLPTRTSEPVELPATWTLTPTPTPTPTSTSTPTPTITPSPTNTMPPSPTWVPTALPTPISPGSNGERWIDVNLSEQLLIAFEGQTPVRWVVVSTGRWPTVTVVGQYRIYVKYVSTLMTGDDYYLPNVPYTMYFYKGYGLHGTYWHNNFGVPMSHGCVNLPTPEAEWLFNWASVGTLVNIHY